MSRAGAAAAAVMRRDGARARARAQAGLESSEVVSGVAKILLAWRDVFMLLKTKILWRIIIPLLCALYFMNK